MPLIHRVDGLAPVSPQASIAAQMHWLVTTAYGLQLLDEECIELWLVAELTDYDLLTNVQYHGGFGELLASDEKDVRARAQVLRERLNNLLHIAMMEMDT